MGRVPRSESLCSGVGRLWSLLSLQPPCDAQEVLCFCLCAGQAQALVLFSFREAPRGCRGLSGGGGGWEPQVAVFGWRPDVPAFQHGVQGAHWPAEHPLYTPFCPDCRPCSYGCSPLHAQGKLRFREGKDHPRSCGGEVAEAGFEPRSYCL